jgi:hypothetical protein
MNTHADKPSENKSQKVTDSLPKLKTNTKSTFQLTDNRPEAIAQRKLQEMMNTSDAPIQRKLMNYSSDVIEDLSKLKAQYPAQIPEIDFHHISTNWYIIDVSSGKIVFHPHVKIPDKREHSSLKRTDFSSDTKKEVLISSGQHRRHIISNHLMNLAINNWQAKHPKEMTLDAARKLLDELNNYQPNLIPGPGQENTAIGMATNHADGILRGSTPLMGSMPSPAFAANIASAMGQPTGFQQNTQSQLLDPVLPSFSEPQTAQFPARTLSLLKDIRDSTDFDWPVGADPSHYESWSSTYKQFMSVRTNPEGWTNEYFNILIQRFLSLVKPVP